MKWKAIATNKAISDCGNYRVDSAMTQREGSMVFFNAWYVPTKQHIEASFDKSKVRAACVRHSQSLAQPTLIATGGRAHEATSETGVQVSKL